MRNRFNAAKSDRINFSKILLSWYTWLNLEKESLNKFVIDNIRDDYFLTLFITRNVGEGETLTLPGGMFYNYSHIHSEPYIKELDAYKRIVKYITNDTIKLFSDEVKSKICSFIIRNEKKLYGNDDSVSFEDANNRLDEIIQK